MENESRDKLKEKTEILKKYLAEIHNGKNVEEAKKEIRDLLINVKPWDIPAIEQELIKDGITFMQIAHMCELHVELFKEGLSVNSILKNVPDNHPMNILIKENDKLILDSEKITMYVKFLDNSKSNEDLVKHMNSIYNFINGLFDIRKHYFKNQMLLFPYLERRGITAVPRVLWTKEIEIERNIRMIHRSISEIIKDSSTIKNENVKEIEKYMMELAKNISDQVFREKNILYPTLWLLMSEGEWTMVNSEMSVIGFYGVQYDPGSWHTDSNPVYPFEIDNSISNDIAAKLPAEIKNSLMNMSREQDLYTPVHEDASVMRSGYLTLSQINEILSTVPFELTFIDSSDHLVYYNSTKNSLFLRTKTTLGRKVDLCHPPNSVNKVKRILEEFRNGEKDYVEFWFNMAGRILYVRYFAVRNSRKEYMGALEVVQDITDIKKIEGEKRLE